MRSGEPTGGTVVLPREHPALAETPGALAAGTRVGRFVVLEEAGAGGMGIVYAAYDPDLDRRVALKILGRGQQRSRESDLRLLREAQAMARLSHPNVVPVFDVGTCEDQVVFLAMEYVGGDTLRRWLAARARTVGETLAVLVDAGRGLAAAHRAGLIHRDFKPENVLVDSDGRARVTDFGIARREGVADEDAPDSPAALSPLDLPLTEAGSTLGTPSYMAPEQKAGGVVDARSDQYAFGITAWEALFGAKPDELRDPPRGHHVAPSVIAALRRALQAAPADRFPSMEPLLAELARDPAARRRRWTVAGALAAAAVAVALGAVALDRSTADTARDPAQACDSAAPRLDGIWDDAAKPRVRTALLAAPTAYAAKAWPGVEKTLDTYRRDWLALDRSICTAHARGQQTDVEFAQRTECLDRRRARLAALVDILGGPPDADLARNAAIAAVSLPPVTDCSGERALDSEPPDDPEMRARVSAVRDQLERANALRTIGRLAEAREIARAADLTAGTAGFPPLLAETAYSVGQLEADNGDGAAAEAALYRAADAAAAAGPSADDALARTWVQLLWVVGSQLVRATEIPMIQRVAEQMVVRAGDEPGLRSDLLLHTASIAYLQADYDTAARDLERMIQLVTELEGADDVDLVAALNTLGATRASQGRRDEARELYQRSLDILDAAVGPGHPRSALILGNMANLLSDEQRFDEARALYQRAIAITETAFGPDSTELASTLNNLAQIEWSQLHYDEAQALMERALALWEREHGPDHPYVGVALMNLGGLTRESGHCDEGLPMLDRAIAIFEKAKIDPGYARTAQRFRGACLIDVGRAAEALPILETNLQANVEAKVTGGDIGNTRFHVARALWDVGRRREALAQARTAREELVTAKIDSDVAAVDGWLQAHPR